MSLCFLCPQPVPPSPVEQSQVWLAVNEDGLCVLDYTMVSFINCVGEKNAAINTDGLCVMFLHKLYKKKEK